MSRRGSVWWASLQTRLVLASVAILVLALLVTSGVFVYRERQQLRADTLKRIAAATNGFTISAFFAGEAPSPHGGVASTLQMEGSEAGAPVPAPDGAAGAVGQGAIVRSPAEMSAISNYRILLVGPEGKVIKDPAGSLDGVTLSYPAAEASDEKRGYVTWSGEPATATAGLTFLSPTTKAESVASHGVKAVAAIDSGSLTADWLAIAPDLALSGLVTLPIAVAAVVLVTRRIIRPLRSLTRAVEAMSRGDFDQRVDVGGRDEVAALASSFTVMAGRVKERDTQLRDLIANVSHDLRTPLTSIQGYAEALADGVVGKEDFDRIGRIIREEARHASSLLANLLSLSEIDSGEVVLRNSVFDLQDVVERCLRRLEPQARQRGVRSDVAAQGSLALVADAEKVERALCNLLENAVKFARSRIHITIAPLAGQAAVSIRNDGPSIPAEAADRIFDRFYRGGLQAGTGLGLAIARQLLELNGGSVELVSPASPVEFRVRLPLPQPPD